MIEPKFFFGVVEDRQDPLKLGRVRVRINDIHPQDSTLVPTASLPWATVMNWIQSAGVGGVGWAPVGIMEGTAVFGVLLDGDDAQIPMVMGTVAGKLGHLTFPAVSEGQGTGEKPASAAATTSKLGAVPQDLINKAVAIARKLKADFGFTDDQAAGVLGNLIVESGLIPNRIQGAGTQRGAPDPSKANGRGYSWAQWDGSRRQQMIAFAAANSLDVQSDECAYQWLAYELGKKKSVQSSMKATTNVNDAVVVWVEKYEVAGKPHTEQRVAYATKVLKGLTGTDVPVRGVGADTDAVDDTKVPNDQPAQVAQGVEPLVQFRGKYPYNKTFRSESGHVMEIDDTPGQERLLNYHTIGTYEEIDCTGRRVVKVVGDNFTVIAHDDNIYVDGSVNLFVSGNVRASVSGDMVAQVGNEFCVESAGAIRLKGSSINLESTSGAINMKSAATINQTSTGDTNIKSGGKVLQSSAGDSSINAGGKAYVNGSEVHWAESGGDAAVAPGAGMTIALHQEELSFILDDDFDEVVAPQAVADGIVTQAQLDQSFNAGSTATPPASADAVKPDVVNTNVTATATDSQTKISTYFKIGDLSTYAAASRTAIIAQRGLSVQDIANNLTLLAVNCLDKIRVQYPNVVVTSGFRKVNNGKSQHEIGQAADMQFSGLSNADLLGVATWIRDSSGIVYDQLLLEHKTYGTGNSWIHISFNKSNNRQQVLTLNNGKTVAQGLVGKGS